MRTTPLLASLALVAASTSTFALTADLSANWSNSANPNTGPYGTWSYNQSTNPLSFVSPWAGTFGGSPQLSGWGPAANTPGNFLPFWFQVTASSQSSFDAAVGDIIVHSTDPTNGASEGPANTLWTTPIAGPAAISATIWAAATLANRQNDYALILNPGPSQSILAFGKIPSTATHAAPLSFSFNRALPAGGQLQLYITNDPGSSFGYFTGLNVHINQTAAIAGDADLSGKVDLTDLSTLLNNFGTTTDLWSHGNFDNAPTIDLTDLSDVLNNFGAKSPNASGLQITDDGIPNSAPEPATAITLLLATQIVFKPRRRQ